MGPTRQPTGAVMDQGAVHQFGHHAIQAVLIHVALPCSTGIGSMGFMLLFTYTLEGWFLWEIGIIIPTPNQNSCRIRKTGMIYLHFVDFLL